jgi:hypothetical protein
MSFDLPAITTGVDSPAESAISIIMFIYLIAALFNLRIPDTGARYPEQKINPVQLTKDFFVGFHVLWRDRLGQISLAVTTLFWGAGATLQFIVLKWAETALNMNLSQGAILQAVSAIGVAGGAVWAASRIPLKSALKVLPYGVVMGLLVCVMAIYHIEYLPSFALFTVGGFVVNFNLLPAYVLLITVGWLAGYFVVPMNALLQHRGHVLLSAGHSIAVQNFNENLSVLMMLMLYALLIWLDVPVPIVITGFGITVAVTMWLVIKKHQANQAEYDSLHLIGESKH